MKTLETHRLILRDWAESDLEDAAAIWPEFGGQEDSRSLLQYFIRVKNNYAIVLKETCRIIGSVGLNEDGDGNENARNVGFILLEKYWNRGLMTEALREIIANVSDITTTLSAGHTRDNTKSEHILKKLGFRYIKTLPRTDYEGGDPQNDLLYYVLEIKKQPPE